LLKKAATKSNTLLKSLKDFLPLLDATVAKQPAPNNSTVAAALARRGTARDENRENLKDVLIERRECTADDLRLKYDQLIADFTQSDSVGACITAIVEGKIDLKNEIFSVLRKLIAAASDREDIATLARIIGDNELKMVATEARKAIAEIDYVLYGPQTVKKAS
jgi:GTP cyclohydrolase III